MGRPWWHKEYWEKRGIYEPKDEFYEHRQRQGQRKKRRPLWVIIPGVMFILVVLMFLGHIFWIGVLK